MPQIILKKHSSDFKLFFFFPSRLVHLPMLENIVYPTILFIVRGWMLSHSHLFLFTNPSARVGYDTRSIFKRSLAGLNSEFSFSWTSCLIKAEEPSVSYHLPLAGGRIIGFIPFPRVLVLREMHSVSSGFELVLPCPFPTTITITPRTPPIHTIHTY